MLARHRFHQRAQNGEPANAGIEPDSLLPGVRLSLSAMTTFALLQQDGYTVNPF
jgi:hypothetical protein